MNLWESFNTGQISVSADSALVGVFTGGDAKLQAEKRKLPDLDISDMKPNNWLASSCFAHNFSNIYKMFIAKADIALKKVEDCT